MGPHLSLDVDGKVRRFHSMVIEWGFDKFISLETLMNDSNGYIKGDSCVFGAEVFVIKHSTMKSPSIRDETNTDLFTWKIEKFSSLKDQKYCSNIFTDSLVQNPNRRLYAEFKLRIKSQLKSTIEEHTRVAWKRHGSVAGSLKPWVHVKVNAAVLCDSLRVASQWNVLEHELLIAAKKWEVHKVEFKSDNEGLISLLKSERRFLMSLELKQGRPEDSIPTIDFALLTMGTPYQRSKVIHDLGKACAEWGFFLVINHGVPENLAKGVFDAAHEFFNLKEEEEEEEEKKEFEGKHPLDPISCGNSYHNANKIKIFVWRYYLKVISYPEFHFPNKPLGFSPKPAFALHIAIVAGAKSSNSNIASSSSTISSINEHSAKIELGINDVKWRCGDGGGCVAVALLSGSGVDGVRWLRKEVVMEEQGDIAMGIPPHTDHGLLTLLIQNGFEGLQVEHNGKWIIVNEIPNSFIVNVGDQLEIFSNGKYKSVMHRAIVNDKISRLSIAIPHGPSLDTTVGPYSNFVECTIHQPAYIPMKYKEYMEQMVIQAMKGKPILEQVCIRLFSKPRRGDESTGTRMLIGAMALLGHAVHRCVPGDMEMGARARAEKD
ncbi:hypothetical protein LguiB_006266 [Lonicera macranthoides]